MVGMPVELLYRTINGVLVPVLKNGALDMVCALADGVNVP